MQDNISEGRGRMPMLCAAKLQPTTRSTNCLRAAFPSEAMLKPEGRREQNFILSPRLPISEWARENFEEQYLGRERKNADAARIKVAAGAQTQTQFRGWLSKRRDTAQTGVKLFSSNFIV